MDAEQIEATRAEFEAWWYDQWTGQCNARSSYFERLPGGAYTGERMQGQWLAYFASAQKHSGEVEKLKARIKELEELGPVIEGYGSASWNDGWEAAEGGPRTNGRAERKARIDAILKGGK
jgi:hypothetical protein